MSLKLLQEDNVFTGKVSHGVDTAFLVKNNRHVVASHNLNHWLSVIGQQKTVAITVRKLAPFDKRLNVTQQEYEKAFCDVVNHLNQSDFQVVEFSTCTGIDTYDKDDRMVAMYLKKGIDNKDKYHVIMDEFNDVEIGKLLEKCHLTIGTRLHSAIISMNFGTPAIAINYEHKSLGVMSQLGLPELGVDVPSLINGNITSLIDSLL